MLSSDNPVTAYLFFKDGWFLSKAHAVNWHLKTFNAEEMSITCYFSFCFSGIWQFFECYIGQPRYAKSKQKSTLNCAKYVAS